MSGGRVGVLPGTVVQRYPDGSVGRFVTHVEVLAEWAVRLQGAVDEVRAAAVDPAGVGQEVHAILHRWGV